MKVENIPHLCAVKGTCNGRTEFANTSAIEQVVITRNGETIATHTIRSEAELDFEFWDYYGVNGTEYTYSCIPMIDGQQKLGVTATVKSQFDNLFVGNLYEQYLGIINVEYTHSTRFNRSYAQTYYSNYPHVIINGDQIYETGNVTGVFIEFDMDNCRFKVEEAGVYKRKLNRFLATAENKIIKTREGDIWTVQVNGEVREGYGRAKGSSVTTFEWTEVGEKPTGGVVIITPTGKKVVMA